MSTSFIQIETLTGQPMNVNGRRVQVRSQVVRLRFPFIQGGLIWNRPVAVWVHTADGRDLVLPVRDVTHITLLLLVAFSLAGVFLFRLSSRKSASA